MQQKLTGHCNRCHTPVKRHNRPLIPRNPAQQPLRRCRIGSKPQPPTAGTVTMSGTPPVPRDSEDTELRECLEDAIGGTAKPSAVPAGVPYLGAAAAAGGFGVAYQGRKARATAAKRAAAGGLTVPASR